METANEEKRTVRNIALLVEDCPDNAARMKENLANEGLKPIHFTNIAEAKSFIGYSAQLGLPIAKIISDIDLKRSSGPLARLDGYRFLKWFHEQQASGAYPGNPEVILYSTTFNKSSSVAYAVLGRLMRSRIESYGYSVRPKEELLNGI